MADEKIYIKFKKGNISAYNALSTKDANTLYYIQDAQRIYLGETLIANRTNIKNAELSGDGSKLTFTKYDDTTFDIDLSYVKTSDVETEIGTGSDTKVASTKAVKDYVDASVSSTFKVKGSKTVNEINELATAQKAVGDVYNVTDSGNINNPDESHVLAVIVGDNIVWTGDDGWDKLAGTVTGVEMSSNKVSAITSGEGGNVDATHYTSTQAVVNYITAQLNNYIKSADIASEIGDGDATKVASTKAVKDYVDTVKKAYVNVVATDPTDSNIKVSMADGEAGKTCTVSLEWMSI